MPEWLRGCVAGSDSKTINKIPRDCCRLTWTHSKIFSGFRPVEKSVFVLCSCFTVCSETRQSVRQMVIPCRSASDCRAWKLRYLKQFIFNQPPELCNQIPQQMTETCCFRDHRLRSSRPLNLQERGTCVEMPQHMLSTYTCQTCSSNSEALCTPACCRHIRVNSGCLDTSS